MKKYLVTGAIAVVAAMVVSYLVAHGHMNFLLPSVEESTPSEES
jgi:hypothetical protein